MTQKIKKIGLMTVILCAVMGTTSCSEEEVGGGSSQLVGTWTSVSATGEIKFSDESLSNTINGKMASYDLTDMVIIDFDKEGKVRYADMGFLYKMYDYSLKNNLLTFTYNNGIDPNTYADLYKIEWNEDEFTLTHGGIFVGDIQSRVAYHLADRELKASGQGSASGMGVSSINLTIKFKKQ